MEFEVGVSVMNVLGIVVGATTPVPMGDKLGVVLGGLTSVNVGDVLGLTMEAIVGLGILGVDEGVGK